MLHMHDPWKLKNIQYIVVAHTVLTAKYLRNVQTGRTTNDLVNRTETTN